MERIAKSGGGGGTKKGDNFKVIVRVRPCLSHEERANAKHCVSVDVEHGVVTIKKPDSQRRSNTSNHLIGIDGFGELIKSDPTAKHDFNFDIIFSPRYIVCLCGHVTLCSTILVYQFTVTKLRQLPECTLREFTNGDSGNRVAPADQSYNFPIKSRTHMSCGLLYTPQGKAKTCMAIQLTSSMLHGSNLLLLR